MSDQCQHNTPSDQFGRFGTLKSACCVQPRPFSRLTERPAWVVCTAVGTTLYSAYLLAGACPGFSQGEGPNIKYLI